MKVKRGEKVEIPLRIYGRRQQTLEFTIRSQPSGGKLGEVKQIDQEVASVTYTPPEDLARTRDQFSYSVRSSAGVSAAVDVVITIVDLPPQLTVTRTLEFPRLLVGETAALDLEIVNRGGGRAEGEVEVDAPWEIVGHRNYRLGAGDRQILKLNFAPTSGGEFRGEARFSSQPDRVTELIGIAEQPIAVTPETVALHHERNDPLRSGSFEVTNNTPREQTLTLTASERLTFPRSLTLGSRRSVSVLVHTQPADVGPLEEEIRIEAPGLSARLPVRAGKVRPILRPRQSVINFGRVAPGTAARAVVEIENAGGTAGVVGLQVAAPFVLEAASTAVEPGEIKQVGLALPPGDPATLQSTLVLQTENGRSELPVEARIGVADPTRTSSRGGGRLMKARLAAAPRAATEVMEDDEIFTRPLGAVGRVREVTARSVTMEWPANLVEAARFRAEMQRLSKQGQELRIEWVNHAPFTTRTEGELIVGTINELAPGQLHIVRVVPVDAKGVSSEPLFEAQLLTRPKQPSALRVTPRRAILFVLLLGGGALAWRHVMRARGA